MSSLDTEAIEQRVEEAIDVIWANPTRESIEAIVNAIYKLGYQTGRVTALEDYYEGWKQSDQM